MITKKSTFCPVEVKFVTCFLLQYLLYLVVCGSILFGLVLGVLVGEGEIFIDERNTKSLIYVSLLS